MDQQRDRNDVVIEMTTENPVCRQRDRNIVVIGMTIVIRHPHCHRDDQINGVAIPGGASKKGKHIRR